MASVMTNKGKYKILGWALRGETVPTDFYMALITSAYEPINITNTFTQCTEVSTGNGYATGGGTGGTGVGVIDPNSTDFDVWTEDDTNHWGLIQVKDIVWTASGGTLPASDSARYAVITDDNATIASREVYFSGDLTSDRQVSDGQTLTIEDFEIRIT